MNLRPVILGQRAIIASVLAAGALQDRRNPPAVQNSSDPKRERP